MRSVADKARLVGYTRLLRRAIRREADSPLGQQRIRLCKQHIAELLERVDTLAF